MVFGRVLKIIALLMESGEEPTGVSLLMKSCGV